MARFSEAADRLKVGDPLDPETQVGSLISTEHRDRVHGYVEAGREEGAEVVTGGAAATGKGAFYPPTVLAQVDNSMKVAQEEIFGPVVTVIPFEDEKDAVRIANDVRYGLMATVWTGDPARGHRLARQIKAGTVGINMPYTAFPGIPFGGYKQSGFGRELGLETLERVPRDEERDRLDEPEAVQPVRAVGACRYRWLVLAAGTAAQTALLGRHVGLPVLAPALRDAYDLSLFRVGLVLDSVWVGDADAAAVGAAGRPHRRAARARGRARRLRRSRSSRRRTLAASPRALLLALAGAAGASVNSASGRAVMQWFGRASAGSRSACVRPRSRSAG